jgi:ATP-dependent phosphofructokinase / diphosphate-dependent phosphofructokinase
VKIGILSGGGDAPGINAVIRAAVRHAIRSYGYETIGIKDGWNGLLQNRYVQLNLNVISGILPRGGSILGTSRTNPFKNKNGPEKTLENAKKKKIDAILAIGGDDTLTVACKMNELGLNCVAVPKTIDNDLAETDITFGFNTAVSIATEAIDRLHTTAEAHHRIIVIEVMGRYTGWIALETGIAGGADVILIPEKPFDVQEVCNFIKQRRKRGKNFSLIVVAEGCKPIDGKEILHSHFVDEFGNPQLGGVGYFLAKEIEKALNIETRVVTLGHLQRGGSPTAFDRVLATRFGKAAVDLISENKFGHMVALKGKDVTSVPLKSIIGKRKIVDLQLYELAKIFFG